MTTLFLIRHGETIANRLNYIQGTLDNEMTALTANGVSEAESYQPLLESNHIDCVYSSPLKRAVKTKGGLPVKVGIDDNSRRQHNCAYKKMDAL